MDSSALHPTELSRLKWRCRRGLLENDLFIERFFRRHEAQLTVRHASGLQALMDLADNDLLDLLLARREPEGELARPEVTEVLGMLRVSQCPQGWAAPSPPPEGGEQSGRATFARDDTAH